ncbi:hypothetical protein GOBAR_AA15559 [Gossypium barbadense]|uniref:Uncharacterized protein n=1 Tax=Gossypium barbadense TaxID=3634 RepID=A0A2P5XP08_GOSBA|nr:hypothetical protein GOBAR_AA15559 [Gossypium barbadense]
MAQMQASTIEQIAQLKAKAASREAQAKKNERYGRGQYGIDERYRRIAGPKEISIYACRATSKSNEEFIIHGSPWALEGGFVGLPIELQLPEVRETIARVIGEEFSSKVEVDQSYSIGIDLIKVHSCLGGKGCWDQGQQWSNFLKELQSENEEALDVAPIRISSPNLVLNVNKIESNGSEASIKRDEAQSGEEHVFKEELRQHNGFSIEYGNLTNDQTIRSLPYTEGELFLANRRLINESTIDVLGQEQILKDLNFVSLYQKDLCKFVLMINEFDFMIHGRKNEVIDRTVIQNSNEDIGNKNNANVKAKENMITGIENLLCEVNPKGDIDECSKV